MSINNHIVFDSVRMGYDGHDVLKDVSLNIDMGKLHCVFGRNGSGKTTFLKSLASILPVQSGNIKLGSKYLSEMKPVEKAHEIAIVLTNRPNIVNMKVVDFVSYGRYPYTNWIGAKGDEDFLKIEEAIENCSIQALKERYLSELSDGEIQKVQIARALAQDVPILLLDEPASHLDLVNKAEIFNLLKNACFKSNKTVLFTSHDIQFALQLANNFVVINEGKAIQMSVEEFKRSKVVDEILSSKYVDFNPETGSLNYKHTT